MLKRNRTQLNRAGLIRGLAVAGCLAVSICTAQAQGQGAKTYGQDIYWNATPNDVNNLLKRMASQASANYSMEIRTLQEVGVDPAQNPILFRTGHYSFEYTPRERQQLRTYLLNGGMIIYNTGLGSMPFYDSVVAELKAIFPEQPLQRLSSDHPIFHSFYDVDRVQYTPAVAAAGFRGNEPWFDAIEINCRVVALVSRWGMAVGWQNTVKDEYQAYRPESAFRLGMNIVTYSSAMRAWSKNAAQSMKFVDASDSGTDKVFIGQIKYDGIWKTRHAGLSVLLQTFNQRTGVPVQFALQDMNLTSQNLFQAPLLYLTGHEQFSLNQEEINMLRLYLQSGGFLFAESCCGRKGFDQSFRKLMRMVLPGTQLKRVPTDSVLFREPNRITQVGLTPSLMQEFGSASVPPYLEAVELDGHYAVLYSRFGLAGGWEMSQSPYARGCNNASAIKLGQNILMYSVTQ